MTNEQDAEALAKLRAWQAVDEVNRWMELSILAANEYVVDLLVMDVGSVTSKRKPSLSAAVDAALEAWDAMERGQG